MSDSTSSSNSPSQRHVVIHVEDMDLLRKDAKRVLTRRLGGVELILPINYQELFGAVSQHPNAIIVMDGNLAQEPAFTVSNGPDLLRKIIEAGWRGRAIGFSSEDRTTDFHTVIPGMEVITDKSVNSLVEALRRVFSEANHEASHEATSEARNVFSEANHKASHKATGETRGSAKR
jgi:hypothetical protein